VSGKDFDKELANRILKQLKTVLMPAPRKVESTLASQRRLAVRLSKELALDCEGTPTAQPVLVNRVS